MPLMLAPGWGCTLPGVRSVGQRLTNQREVLARFAQSPVSRLDQEEHISKSAEFELQKDRPVSVNFSDDSVKVTFRFRDQGKEVGESRTCGRTEAIRLGKQIMETGIYEPSGVSVDAEAMKKFGRHLLHYGEELKES